MLQLSEGNQGAASLVQAELCACAAGLSCRHPWQSNESRSQSWISRAMTAASDKLPRASTWPDRPVLLRSAMCSTEGFLERVNSGPAMQINTALFEGKAKFWAAGFPFTPSGIFEGHRRATSLTVQVRPLNTGSWSQFADGLAACILRSA